MSAEERKLAIVNAAKPLFAANGFNGTSVRDIAKAANVSGALLYKHFPSKEALYKEIISYINMVSNVAKEAFKEMEPGAETLVLLIYSLYQAILFEVPGNEEKQKMHERLLFYSMLEDVNYAKMAFEKVADYYLDLALTSYDKAVEDGDIVETGTDHSNLFWFVHHLAMALNLCHLSPAPVFSYATSKGDLANEAVLFALRGIGFKDAAIRKYYKPVKLNIFVKGVFAFKERGNM
jgi:AcrR family transcriptional regulator